MTPWYVKGNVLKFSEQGFETIEKRNATIAPPEPIRLSDQDIEEMKGAPSEYAAFALWAVHWLEEEEKTDLENGLEDEAQKAKELRGKLNRFLYEAIEI